MRASFSVVADSGHLHVHLWGELHGGVRALGLRLGQSKDFVLTQAGHDITGIDLGVTTVITVGVTRRVRVGSTFAATVCITVAFAVAVTLGVRVALATATAAAFTFAAALRLAVDLGELLIAEQVKYLIFGHRDCARLCLLVSGFVEGFLHLGALGFGVLNFLAGLSDLLLAGVALVARVIVRGAVFHGLLDEFALDLVTNGLLHIGVLVGLVRVRLHDLNTVGLLNGDLAGGVLGHENVDVLIGGRRDGNICTGLGALLGRGSCGRSGGGCRCFGLGLGFGIRFGISTSCGLGSVGGLVVSWGVGRQAGDNLVKGIDQDSVLVLGLDLGEGLVERRRKVAGQLFALDEHSVRLVGCLHQGHSVKRKSHFCSLYLCLKF